MGGRVEGGGVWVRVLVWVEHHCECVECGE